MSQSVKAAPLKAPFPAEEYLTLSFEEALKAHLRIPVVPPGNPHKIEQCAFFAHIGLFFDGTNNNMKRDHDDIPDPYKRSHSNVVRLYKAFKTEVNFGRNAKHYPFYMPGVGTAFPEIGEDTESQNGKAFAKGGQARIMWALLQVYNAVHRSAYNSPLYNDDAMADLIHRYENEVTYGQRPDPEAPRLNRREWFVPLTQELSAKLKTKLDQRIRPKVPKALLYIFGFSRGAVEARAFCYWLQDVLEDGLFAGIPIEVRFMGLFDSVASVGLPDSVAQTMPVPGFIADGHAAWAAEIVKPLPDFVKQTVHYIAAHELRMNFPLTRVKGTNVTEVLYPGVHSDVGGGYAPAAQGKCDAGQAALLSQIPLFHMYRTALLASVPFKRYVEMDDQLRDGFTLTAELAQAYEDYMQWVQPQDGDFKTELARHMHHCYQWRVDLLRAGGVRRLTSFRKASPQDQTDLMEAEVGLKADLLLLQIRRDVPRGDDGGIRLSPREIELTGKQANMLPLLATKRGQPLTLLEHDILDLHESPTLQPLTQAQLLLFENFMHDSYAGFYLGGYLTEYDKTKVMQETCEKVAQRTSLNPFERDIVLQNPGLFEGAPGHPETCITLPEGMVFPVQTDAHAPSIVPAPVRLTQTNTRREGGGYLRLRAVFGSDR